MMTSLWKRTKPFTPLATGFLACALFAVQAGDAIAQRPKSDFSSREQKLILSILHTLTPLIRDKEAAGDAPLLAWPELMQPLDDQQRAFVEKFRKYSGALDDADDPGRLPLIRMDEQYTSRNGRTRAIPPQYVTEPLFDAYLRMSRDMQQDIGKTLKIESGYRSPAYQLYLFLARLPRYRYNIVANRRYNALPGRSEHGSLPHLAVDFINDAGINGNDNAKRFTSLPEYRWMIRHAEAFGFTLSFPRRTAGSAFEPWHWRFREPLSAPILLSADAAAE